MRFSSTLLLCGLLLAVPSLYAQQAASSQPPTAPSQAQAPSTTPAAPPPLKLESLPPLSHTLTPAQQQALQAKRILASINNLARAQANWGPSGSTPGASLALIDKGHKSTPEGTQITFTLKATGFQPGDSIRLLRWPLDKRIQQVTSGLTVDAAGQVICPEISQGDCLSSMQPGNPVQIHEIAARGEPLRLAILSANGKKRAEAAILPYPIEATSKTCTMEVILGTKNAALVLLEGIGFPKSQKIEIHVVTDGQDHPTTVTSSPAGGILVAVLPATAGHTTGTSTIRYHGPSCSPSLSFSWGKGSYQPL